MIGFLHELDQAFHRRIPEIIVPGKPLGRHVHYDPRSKKYPAELAPQVKSVLHKSAPDLPLNQAVAGSCTAEALLADLMTIPHWAPGGGYPYNQQDAYYLYSREQQLMGYGPYPPNDNGGSGTEVCQTAKNAGILSAYQHAATLEEALLALTARPVVTGVNWYDSFDSPSTAGLIEIAPGATVRGGHEFAVTQILLPERLVGCWQSWGGWGFQGSGRFFMSFDTWGRLISEQGDVTIPRTAHGWTASPISA